MTETIKLISPWEAYPVRHLILRPGKPIETCQFNGDDLASTVHLGLFEEENLAGIISIFESKSLLSDSESQYQFRGMAVLNAYQSKGIGEKLLHAAENHVKSRNGSLIWMNARAAAVGFYEKNGYKKAGDLFEIAGVGPHYVMYKII